MPDGTLSTTATTTAPATTAPVTGAPASTAATMAAPVTTSGAAPTTETINPGAWMAGMSDDMKGYINNKGFKDPTVLADAYRNFEKLQGIPQDRLMKLPERFYDDAGKLTAEGQGVFERLGAPKDAKEYGLKLAEGADPRVLEGFTSLAKEIGLTKTQAAALDKWNAEGVGALRKNSAEAATARFRDDDAAIKKEWGAAYDQERNIAADGMRKLGWDNAKVDKISGALGHAETMRLLNQIGKATGESTFVNGGRRDPIKTPGDAASKINELKGDKAFGDRLLSGDRDAKAMWDRLHAEAYPGQL